MSRNVEAMHRVFREQHRQMIEEQKKLLEDYREYFDGVLQQIEESERPLLSKQLPQVETGSDEDAVKEIAEISALLNEAIKTQGKELADILVELTERQRKRNEENDKKEDTVD